MRLLENKVVLVTGATSGIGRASAVLFAAEGAKVALTGRRSALGAEVVSEITKAGGEAFFIEADVADPTSAERTVAAVVQKYGRLDAAFNNAGVGGGRIPLLDQKPEDWDKLFGVNGKAVFFALQAQARQFRKQKTKGAIVLNASVLAGVGFPGVSLYSASKGAVVTMMRSSAVELAPEGIRVNSVSPSITRTEMTEEGYADKGDGVKEHPMAKFTPLGRTAEAIEVAQAAAFLLSDRASYITGHDLLVDGGLSAT